MGLFFKLGQVVPRRYLNFHTLKNGFFKARLKRELTYLIMAPKRRFFCKFLGKNTQNFVKNDPNCESKGYLMQNFMELDMKKSSDTKALTFGV